MASSVGWVVSVGCLLVYLILHALAMDVTDYEMKRRDIVRGAADVDLTVYKQTLDAVVAILGMSFEEGALQQAVENALAGAPDSLAALAASLPLDKLQEILDSLTSFTSREIKQKRGPTLVEGSAYTPNFPSCDPGGAFYDFVSPLQPLNVIAPEDGQCNEASDLNGVAVIHGANFILQGNQIVQDTICDASKPSCISTIVGAPCIPISGAFCAAKAVSETLLAASDLLVTEADLNDQAVAAALTDASYQNSVEIFEAVTCLPAAGPRKYHGCNDADENCDLVIDDCGEDVFPPELIVDVDRLLSLPKWFSSYNDAFDFISTITQAVDDCQVNTEFADPFWNGTCGDTTLTFSVRDSCGNSEPATFGLPVDDQAPSLECWVAKSQLPSLRLPALVDVGFDYAASDNCVDPDVDIVVLSREPSSSFLPDAYVKRSYDGTFVGVDVRNYASTKWGRQYLILATATDSAGNTATCSQTVIVPGSAQPSPDYNPDLWFSVL